MLKNTHDQYRKGNLWFIAIGKKGFDYLRKQKFNILEEDNHLFNNLTFENVSVVAMRIMESFVAGKFDRVEMIYNQFKNAAVQNLTNEVFPPCRNIPTDKKATVRH